MKKILAFLSVFTLLSANAFAVYTDQVVPDTGSVFDTSHVGENPAPLDEPVLIVFDDITEHWAKSYIEQLLDLGVVKGKTEDTFDPNGYITRAELTKIALLGYQYSPETSVSTTSFIDVLPTDWFAPYVELAKEAGIIKGYGYLFKPNAFITRAEALKVLAESAGLNPSLATGLLTFTDVNAGDWFYNYVRMAVGMGVVSGYEDNTFRPGAFITRAEASKILVLFMQAQ